jgi:hypothetical protein
MGEHAKDCCPVIEEFHRERPRLFVRRLLHPFTPRTEFIQFFLITGREVLAQPFPRSVNRRHESLEPGDALAAKPRSLMI